MIETIQKYLNKEAVIEYRPFHKADLKETWADITKAEKILGWKPKISFEEGIKRTIDWYIENRDWLKEVEVGNE